MSGYPPEDRFTNTVADAASYERWRSLAAGEDDRDYDYEPGPARHVCTCGGTAWCICRPEEPEPEDDGLEDNIQPLFEGDVCPPLTHTFRTLHDEETDEYFKYCTKCFNLVEDLPEEK
jgi:hypothetical protein